MPINSASGRNIGGGNKDVSSHYRGFNSGKGNPYPDKAPTSFNKPPKPQMKNTRTSMDGVQKGRLGGPRNSAKDIREKPKKSIIDRLKDFATKGENKGIGPQVPDLSADLENISNVDYSKDNRDSMFGNAPLRVDIPIPKTHNPGALMRGPRRRTPGQGSYQRGTPTRTKMVTAPGRGTGPGPKKVRVADRPVTRKKKTMINPTRGFSGGGLVASLYD
tara:strand:+ start:318 stop:971 length:654 start_codon:yes stop_codon:yes gene_type:complete